MRHVAFLLFAPWLVAAPLAAQQPCTVPPPPRNLDPTALGDRAQLLEYARSLPFHPAAGPTGDTRPLTTISTPGDRSQRRFRLSVDAATQPQECAHRNRMADLRSGAGRIVSRHTLSAAYDKLSLPAGVSYLWVDNLDGAAARGVVIPDDLTTPARVVTIRMEFHPDLPQRAFAESRWLFDPEDDTLWVACVEFGCCEVIGGGP